MTKEELIQLAIDSQGTNFGYEDMTEEERLNNKIYLAKIKVQKLSPEDKAFVFEYQKNHRPSYLSSSSSLFSKLFRRKSK